MNDSNLHLYPHRRGSPLAPPPPDDHPLDRMERYVDVVLRSGDGHKPDQTGWGIDLARSGAREAAKHIGRGSWPASAAWFPSATRP
jgi:hypothetical protein